MGQGQVHLNIIVGRINGYYGMQFAVGRGESYPKLSIRRKENNSWTGW